MAPAAAGLDLRSRKIGHGGQREEETEERGENDARLVNHQLVVQAKLALGRATQIRPHQNLTVHIGPQNGSCSMRYVVSRAARYSSPRTHP